MIKKIIIITLYIMVLCVEITPQTNEKVILAKAGDIEITRDEFIQRFELVPQIGQEIDSNIPRLKENLLYTIIAEKLFSKYGVEEGLDSSEVMKYTYTALEKMYLRDALWKLEISEKVIIPETVFVKAAMKKRDKLKLNYITSYSKPYIFEIYDSLKTGASFDSILAMRPELAEQTTPWEITYGSMVEEIEDSLYKLLPGQFAYPFETPFGWYIFRLNSREEKIITTQQQANVESKNVRETVERRETDKVYQKFYRDFFGGTTINSNGQIYWSLVNKITDILQEKKIRQNITNENDVHLEVSDIKIIETQFGKDSLNMIFIKFESEPVSLKKFLREFIFEGFYSKEVDEKNLSAKLNSRIKRFIESELLTREAYKRGLDKLPEVINSLDMWKGYYLSSLVNRSIYDTLNVTEEEIQAASDSLMSGKGEQTLVNIIEILTDSLEVIETVLNEIEAGKDFRMLAKLHTKRSWTKDKGGEFGLFPTTMYGEIGRIAGEMQVGEIYGPLELPDGYSIFKLTEKKTENITGIEHLNNSGESSIKDQLTSKKYYESKVNKAVSLANKFGIEIDYQKLYETKVTNTNLFAYRYMGFGGRISAVPIVSPFTEWFEKWKQSKADIP